MRAIGGLVPMLVVLAVVLGVMTTRRRSTPGARVRSGALSGPPSPGAPTPAPTVTRAARGPAIAAGEQPDAVVTPLLDRWVAAGLLRDEQRAAIIAHEAQLAAGPAATAAPGPAPRRRVSALAEGLGYLGGMLTVSGLSLIVINAWPDLSTTGRLAVSGGAAAVLLVAGRAAPEHADPALARLRWFLWLAGTAAAALFAGVAAAAGDRADVTVVLAAATTVAVVGGLLWRGSDRPLQQLSLLGGLVVAVGSLVAEVAVGGVAGLAVWSVGAVYIVVGLRDWIGERLLFEAGGALATVVGAGMVASEWEGTGLLFVVATAFGLLAVATLPAVPCDPAGQRVVGILGGFALLQGAPAAIGWFAEGAGAVTGLAVGLVGAALLAMGLRGASRIPVGTQVLGAVGALVGAAVIGAQWAGVAPIVGIATAVALVAVGTRRGETVVSTLGAIGLLANIPWAITHFFPGEGQVPLAAVVTGALFVGLALWLSRSGGRGTHHRPLHA